MKTLSFYRPYVFFIGGLLFFLGLALIVNNQTIRLAPKEATVLNDCWQTDSHIGCLELPVKLAVATEESYTVTQILPEAFDEAQNILIRTSLQNIEVRLDDDVIYQVNYENEATYASMWHVIEIPHGSNEALLSLTFSSPYEAMSGTINEVVYGSDLALRSSIASQFGYRVFIGVFTLITGLSMTVISALYNPKHSKRYAYVGMFAVLISLWVISESRMLQYVTGNIFIIGSLSYLSLAVFPIPIVKFLKEYVLDKLTLPLVVICGVFTANVALIIGLHFTGFLDFFESVIITQTIIGTGLLMVFGIMIYEYKVLDNQKTVRPLVLLSVLFVFGLFEFVTFITSNFDQTSVFLVTGLFIVMVSIIEKYVRFLSDRIKLSYEKDFYEKLAFIDPLTEANNRLAFEGDMQRWFNDETVRLGLRLIYFDLDDLKSINDDYGHLEGDETLKKTYVAIADVFGDIGTCYRVGGDEFACIVVNQDEAIYQDKKDYFKTRIDALNRVKPYHIRMSIGSKVYDGQLSLDAFIKLADRSMYDNKNEYKGRLR